MPDTALKNFTAAAAWTSTCSVVGSDSATPTGSFLWTKAKFDLIYPTLAGANTFVGANIFTLSPIESNPTNGSGPSGAFEFLIKNSANAGVLTNSGGAGTGTLALASSNVPLLAILGGTNSASVRSDGAFAFASAANPIFGADAAFRRAAAGVIEVDDGTAGTGHGAAINFPRTAADADAPAPASGATLYSKQVAGKNALFVRFPSGASQQIAIEL